MTDEEMPGEDYEAEPTEVPTEEWTHEDIDAWAEAHDIDVPASGTKAEKVAAITEALEVQEYGVVTVRCIVTSPYGRPGQEVTVTRTPNVDYYLTTGVLKAV